MNNELEKIWKERAVAKLEVLSRHFSGRNEKNRDNSLRIDGVPAEMRTLHLLLTSQK
jgi:hypothetical protein